MLLEAKRKFMGRIPNRGKEGEEIANGDEELFCKQYAKRVQKGCKNCKSIFYILARLSLL